MGNRKPDFIERLVEGVLRAMGKEEAPFVDAVAVKVEPKTLGPRSMAEMFEEVVDALPVEEAALEVEMEAAVVTVATSDAAIEDQPNTSEVVSEAAQVTDVPELPPAAVDECAEVNLESAIEATDELPVEAIEVLEAIEAVEVETTIHPASEEPPASSSSGFSFAKPEMCEEGMKLPPTSTAPDRRSTLAIVGSLPSALIAKAFSRSTYLESLELLRHCDPESRRQILNALGEGSPLRAAFDAGLSIEAAVDQ